MQTAFFPHVNGKFKCIPFSDVLYITAKKNYSEVLTIRKKPISLYIPLGHLENQLPENLFCRVHRSYIVSLLKIEEFDHTSILIDKEEIPLSKAYFEKLSKRLMLVFNDYDKKKFCR